MAFLKNISFFYRSISFVTCFVLLSKPSFSQLNYSGIVQYNPSGNGIIADVKVSIVYKKVETGLEAQIAHQLASFKGIRFNGRSFAPNQLPANLLQEYSKLPAELSISFNVYRGQVLIKEAGSGSLESKISWEELLKDEGVASAKGEELKIKGSKLFYTGQLGISRVQIKSIPFNAGSIDKHLKGSGASSNTAAKPVSRPAAVKTVPASYISPVPPRLLKQSSENLSRIIAAHRRTEDFLDNSSIFIANVDGFVNQLQSQAKASREIKEMIDQGIRSRLASKDKKKSVNIAETLAELEKASLSGDPYALRWLARAYTTANLFTNARSLYQFLAANNDVHASKMIAQTFQYERKYYEAIQYYEKSARQNDVESMKKLGAIYSGYLSLKTCDLPYPQFDSTNYSVINLSSYRGVDFDKAVQWYERAAAENDTEAMIRLANLWGGEDERRYLADDRTPNNFTFRKDLAKAQIWLEKAIALGDGEALRTLATISTNELKNAGKAQQLLNQAKSHASPAKLFSEGLKALEAKNPTEAFNKLKKSAELRNTDAMVKVAELYSNGLGTKRNDELAFFWLLKAAQYGHSDSYYPIANFYHLGKGITRDLQKAYEYYLQGANKAVPEAMGQLGFMFYEGAGIERNLKKSLKYFIEAQAMGFRDSYFYIGNIFRFGGAGIHKNGNRAISWYEKAIQGMDFAGYKFIADTYASEKSDIPDYKKAIENYIAFLENEKNPAVLQAHKESAIREIARLYTRGGYGLDPDPATAKEWLAKLQPSL